MKKVCNDVENPHRYADMLNMPHHVSSNHHPMPMQARAAQFMPFAALTGYEEMIEEAGRETEDPVFLSEESLNALDQKMQVLIQKLSGKPVVQFTLYQKDEKKSGGRFIEKSGVVRKIDSLHEKMTLMDGTVIQMDEIIDMESHIFDDIS